ncbi:DUF4129 domain-containing protein [Roseivirga echinicomitans]
MRKHIKLFFLLITLQFAFASPPALATVAYQAPQTELRSFDTEKLNEYRADKRFQYEVYKAKPKGFLARLWDRIVGWFNGLFGSAITSGIIEILFYALLIGAFVFFIVKLSGIQTNTLFKKAKSEVKPYQVDEETLNDIDFETEIQQAISQSQWRIALRLTYLYALKRISDANLIAIRKGKTNHEYLYELSGHTIEKDFASLSFLFDYTWYGHFEASETMVEKARTHLESIGNLKSLKK